ncbi:MAG: 4-hydroxythreonine-4-phosphate dehydrogenase PdxA [Deltaproteobacteria bacterium]|nr:4-hydroxythreonine-4-phosphate dehydrogenase PdxA [Deltaproteobacteria bacterium]
MKRLPVIGITMGDPAGIGPEIILALLNRRKEMEDFLPLVFGSAAVFDTLAEHLAIQSPFHVLSDIKEFSRRETNPCLLDFKNIAPADFAPGEVSAAAGRASIEYVLAAIDAALKGDIDAIVTAPIHKEAVHLAGFNFAGHTELLAAKTGTSQFAMMLMGGPIRVILVTTHLALREVPHALTPGNIEKKILLAHQAMLDLGFSSPRIAVAALNPHAGEHGLFGEEEEKIILPAVIASQKKGINVTGPLPPDTVFHQAYHGRFHAIVSMYHDQGLIPLKMIAFEKGVNVTLGLPIIRTSVDHGTAFDISGQGKADPSSLMEAVSVGLQLAAKGIDKKNL